jgi:hypothetical protein
MIKQPALKPHEVLNFAKTAANEYIALVSEAQETKDILSFSKKLNELNTKLMSAYKDLVFAYCDLVTEVKNYNDTVESLKELLTKQE